MGICQSERYSFGSFLSGRVCGLGGVRDFYPTSFSPPFRVRLRFGQGLVGGLFGA